MCCYTQTAILLNNQLTVKMRFIGQQPCELEHSPAFHHDSHFGSSLSGTNSSEYLGILPAAIFIYEARCRRRNEMPLSNTCRSARLQDVGLSGLEGQLCSC